MVSVATKVTLAPHWPVVLFTVILPGQTITGATPTTVTVNEHCAVLLDASTTKCVTVVVPIGKVEPLARPAILIVNAPGQLSIPTGVV